MAGTAGEKTDGDDIESTRMDREPPGEDLSGSLPLERRQRSGSAVAIFALPRANRAAFPSSPIIPRE
ncbi:MAG: hypothetical protein ACO394_12140, partial [Blastocatellia bacterium]